MNTRYYPAVPVGILFLLSSCFKDDDPVTPHPRGEERSDTVAMSSTYAWQVFFDLDSLGTVSTSHKSEGDLAFSRSPDGWHLLLNSANFMYADDLGEVPFGVPQDTSGARWWFDRSDGNPDSTAIGVWFEIEPNGDTISNRHVYVINRGIDELGNPLGYVQLSIDSLKNGNYYFRFAPLEGGSITPGFLSKDPSVNLLYFSFDEGGRIINKEPPKNTWDLMFTQYTTLLFTDLGEPYPYLVTGVLNSRDGIEIARDTLHSFSEIGLEMAMQAEFSANLDAIGYDWKYYNFETGSYTVDAGITYLIRNRNGFLYKLRFTGFYNAVGQKGYPSFDYQRL